MITRAEFITFANNVLERVPQTADDLLEGEMKTWPDNADKDCWHYIAIQEATNSHDYVFKPGQIVPGKQFEYESWTEMEENRDWLKLEMQWGERLSGK
jgi:hypothetical protein